MRPLRDGPASRLFRPLSVGGKASFAALAESGVSAQMVTAAEDAPKGACVCWGIPFQVDDLIPLVGAAVELTVERFSARWLVFLHTSDLRPTITDPGGLPTEKRGRGVLGEHAADYVIHYADGGEVRLPVRRRYQVGAFTRRWGDNCFEAVAQHKPHPIPPPHEQAGYEWGFAQTRARAGDSGDWVNWLWAWENPEPERAIAAIRLEPFSGALVLSAVTAGDVSEVPLRWRPRRKAVLSLSAGASFAHELDEQGALRQVQLDLGQIISATPRRVYPNATWDQTWNNQAPLRSSGELVVEYASHPEAAFYLDDGRVVPVSEVESGASAALMPVSAATQRVRVRVVQAGSTRPVAVKLHLHGEAGEYLAPVDRHRIPNPAWFEDYSVDFLHDDGAGTHPSTYIPGETTVDLPVGPVYLEASKGFEVRPVRRVLEITGSTEEITLELEKVLPWRERGWVTADTHVHFLSPISALLEGSAEGVNVINLLASQWGELMTNVGDFDGRTTWGSREAGGDGEYLVRVGSENRQHVLGHISLLGYGGPLIAPMTTGGPDESAIGDPIEVLLTEWARRCKQQDGVVVLPHFPDPRAEHAASIVSGDVDAVEMTSWGQLYNGIDPYSLADWYRYLNCGYRVGAVGGTDKMSASMAVGTVRTYAHIAPGEPFTYEAWKAAVRRAETFVTYGPLLDFAVDGKPMGSRFEMGSNGGTVDVVWTAASVTVPMSRVELVVNGEIRQSVAVSPWQASGQWSVKLPKSSWLALLVRGGYAGRPEIVAAHSSPVMVDVAGSEMLAAADGLSILEQIEGALAYLDTVGTRAQDAAYKRMRLVLTSTHRSLHNRIHQHGRYHEHPGAAAGQGSVHAGH